MDQLKAVGKAIRNSPRAIRKKLGQAPHEKLDEDWYHSEDPVKSGVTFYVKYLGSTEVEKTHGAGSTDDAVKRIVHHAKGRGGKLQKVQLTISSKFLKIIDATLQMRLEEIPLYRVSYCTVDPYYDKIFCYISRNSETKKLECHAFLCSKKSKAEAITITVAQAFNIAFERWQKRKAAKQAKIKAEEEGAAKVDGASPQVTNGEASGTTSAPDLIDDVAIGSALDDPIPPTVKPLDPIKESSPQPEVPQLTLNPPPTIKTSSLPPQVVPSQAVSRPHPRRGSRDDSFLTLLSVKTTIPKAVSLDYLKLEDEFDAEFTKLAEARSNPQLLAIGDHINRQDMSDDILELMKGDKSKDDIMKSRSHEDLVTL